jgi:thiol-disulfide isomerase/thioredoxin
MRFPSLKAWLIFVAGFASCLAGLIALIFAAYLFWLKPMQSQALSQLSAPDFFVPQTAAFDVSAVGKNATPMNLRDYRGRVVVLNIWATWCPPCMAELPGLGKLAAHYATAKDVAVICLSQEPADTVFKSSGALASGAPIYSLNGHSLPNIYNTEAIPATFVIDTHGMIVFKHIGSADWSDASVTGFIDSLRNHADTALESTATTPLFSTNR